MRNEFERQRLGPAGRLAIFRWPDAPSLLGEIRGEGAMRVFACALVGAGGAGFRHPDQSSLSQFFTPLGREAATVSSSSTRTRLE